VPIPAKLLLKFALAALLQTAIIYAHADDLSVFDLSLDSLLQVEVTTASRQSEAINEAPSIISVITREDIERYGSVSLRDIVGRLPGINLLSDFDYQSDNLSLRGDDVYLNNHMLLLIDGNPYRSVPDSSDPLRRLLNSFPVDMVEQVELIRGPGSVLYGAGAFTGVINVITRKKTKTSQTLTLGTGSNSAKFASASGHYYNPDNHASLSLNLSGWDDTGWTASLVDINQQPTRVRLGEDFRVVVASGNYKDSQFMLYSSNRDSDTLGQRIGSMPGELNDEQLYLSLSQGFQINNGWQAKSSGSWLQRALSDESLKNNEYFFEQELTGQLSDSLELVFGINTMKTKLVSNDERLRNNELDATQVFSQLAYQYSPNTKYVVGGQLNRAQGQNSDFVPRLAVTHQFSSTWGTKILYSEAYRSPNVVEIGAIIPLVIRGNPELESETVDTFELEGFYHNNSTFLSLALYHSKQKNLISRQFNETDLITEYQNVHQRVFYGSELTFSHAFTDAIKIDGSASYQRNKETSDKDIHDITTLPRFSAKLGISYSDDHHRFALWDNYVGNYRNNKVLSSSFQQNNPAATDYHYLTAHYSWRSAALSNSARIKDFEFKVYVQNLLDETIRQNSLSSSTLLNTYPSETSRAFYLSFTLGF